MITEQQEKLFAKYSVPIEKDVPLDTAHYWQLDIEDFVYRLSNTSNEIVTGEIMLVDYPFPISASFFDTGYGILTLAHFYNRAQRYYAQTIFTGNNRNASWVTYFLYLNIGCRHKLKTIDSVMGTHIQQCERCLLKWEYGTI